MQYAGNSCSRGCFLFFTFFFWLNGLCLLCYGLWMIFDPARSYALDLVDFSEDDPLLKFATYTILGTAIFMFFAGFVGCLGALKSERCLVASFISFLMLVFLSMATIVFLSLSYKDKFPNDRMTIYLANISQNRYYRDKWVQPLMDTIQFYQQCCGGAGPTDYSNSFWYLTNTERGTRSFVPRSCCRQSQNGRAWSLEPIDSMCTTYNYYSKSFNDSVNIKGCGKPMKDWIYNYTYLFIVISVATAIIDLIGIIIGAIYIRQISGYSFVV
ncbi:tetraspanin family domain-containing protein [Ditylenchus destructor]|uniref:Tetraspanin n=1 Tax=Ditylenchus destructor TaxID=166010 RepID=A0AAD4NB73_9BILA|nr:tetraspanin family domain-containing protein [Ditylenchus destructor]